LLTLQQNNIMIFWDVTVYSSVSQTVGCDSYLGCEGILSGSQNNFMTLFITKSHSHTILISVLRNIFVNVVTCSDTVAMLA
jgi:hypothetical protein